MNTKLALISIAALGGFAAFANSASANPDIRVGIGFNAPAPIVVVDHRDHYDYNRRYDYHRYNYDRSYRPSGFWKEIVVKTWVPECYVTSRDWRGRPVRRIEPGHFAFRTDRVWVNGRG